MTATPHAADLATRQSLAHGSLGTVLLDVERAHRGTTAWHEVQRRLTGIGPLMDGYQAGLFLGAPAMALVLHLAAADTGRYANALAALDRTIAAHTRQRVAAAHTRIDHGIPAAFAEYDLLRGLTGIGALLLRRAPTGDDLRGVLEYLVRLTQPLPDGHPGWWVWHGPTNLHQPAPAGHANAGLAHGITGPLALLALATLRGVTVPGQETAMQRICHWLDHIRQTDHHGAHWPRWTHTPGPAPHHTGAPSWCYGTPGIVRAQQLAALALEDPARQRAVEEALLSCIGDPAQLDQLTGRGLCHGVGGLLRVVQRVAADALDPHRFLEHVPRLTQRFLAAPPPQSTGFLEGTAGAALAFQSADTPAPACDWDTSLLLV
ncbi:lanthionine synthetase C family protein [Streptomyces globosus]|uniref:lanthionine synthetase C family protein n=1 Tax=Streptomyces globosus TaxID=68209 RepID=UPI00382F2403